MEIGLLITTTVLALIGVILLIFVLKRLTINDHNEIMNALRDEFHTNRNESAEDSKRLREEVTSSQKAVSETLVNTISELGKSQQSGLTEVENRVKSLSESNESRLEKLRESIKKQMKDAQLGNQNTIEKLQEAITNSIDKMKQSQENELKAVEKRVNTLSEANEARLEKLRETVDNQMKTLQEKNDKRLEEMRATVDEKLQSTLEKRLGESFKLVSERLEAVQRGLGDMQNLAKGVGDLKRVLTNVKTRGTWGEYQIGDILEQIMSPEQYEKNVKPNPRSGEMVEYAIRLPGQEESSNLWLPIDSKFPQEDYQRLLDAAESADSDAVDKSTTALIRVIRSSAKEISQKYIEPPHTTDFAIMFLPTEGLYSEVLRQPGMVEELQHKFRVVIAGPTTLSAILSSLRMGFRTLAIEKRSSEVWTVLSAVKTEFGKFGDILKKVKKQLDTASNTIEKTGVRTRAMERKLKDVEAMPTEDSTRLLELDGENDLQDSVETPVVLLS